MITISVDIISLIIQICDIISNILFYIHINNLSHLNNVNNRFNNLKIGILIFIIISFLILFGTFYLTFIKMKIYLKNGNRRNRRSEFVILRFGSDG